MGAKSSSLHNAVLHRDRRTLRRLLDSKSGCQEINERENGRTALFRAVTDGQMDTARMLLEAGALPDVQCQVTNSEGDVFDWTALHEAARRGSVDIVTLLLENGSDVNVIAHKLMTALHVAAWHGNATIVRLLIDKGCDIDQLDEYQESALVVPICHGDTTVVRQLLEAGSRLNTRSWANTRKLRGKHELDFQKTLYGRHGPYTLLLLAIKYAWLHLAVLLLQHGFNPNKYQIHDLLRSIKSNMGSLNTQGQILVRCFLDTGYTFRSSDERLLGDLLVPDHHGYDQDFIHWLQQQCGQPPLLSHVCMCVIRSHLRVSHGHRSILNHVKQLTLPHTLIQALSLSQYDAFVDTCVDSNNVKNAISPHKTISTGRCRRHRTKRWSRVSRLSHRLQAIMCSNCCTSQRRHGLCSGVYDESAEEWVTSDDAASDTNTIEPLYFAMPRKTYRVNKQKPHIYVLFWRATCCCFSW